MEVVVIRLQKAHEFLRHQCYETTKQVAGFLGLEEGKYSNIISITFGSRSLVATLYRCYY